MFEKIIKFLHDLLCKPKDSTAKKTSVEIKHDITVLDSTAPKAPIEIKSDITVSDEKTSASHSRRGEDLSAEAQLAYFMDQYLYANFPTGKAFSTIRRVHDKEEQLSGVDVEFVGVDSRVYYVDEKAQLYYLNRNLPTFAFELLFKRGCNDTTGWLCNPKLKTDFYMLIWPFATQNTPKGISWTQFTKADCLLIQKQRLLKMLAHKGLTVERLQADARDIRASGRVGKIPIPGLAGIYYYASDSSKYSEAPINVVISKSLLMDIAQRRYIVTPESISTE